MKTHILGYPRIGSKRELKKACEQYWAGKITKEELKATGKAIRNRNWQLQMQAGLDTVCCNDFSFYDQVLDMILMTGAIPERYENLATSGISEMDLRFAMARGYQQDEFDITAMEMTKWFDTNYHYIVPEFRKDQNFHFYSHKVIEECKEALDAGFQPRPVLPGAVSFLLLGKEKEENFHRVDLLEKIMPVYQQILQEITAIGVSHIQFDEPYLMMDLDERGKTAIRKFYNKVHVAFPQLSVLLATYFETLGENTSLALELPVQSIHIDMVRGTDQLDDVLKIFPGNKKISLGIVDGRNIWKNDFDASLKIIKKAVGKLGNENVMIAPSCSLLHVPCDLEMETNEKNLSAEIKNWMAFARQKLDELRLLKELASDKPEDMAVRALEENRKAMESKRHSALTHKKDVKDRVATINENCYNRQHPFAVRKQKQSAVFNLPLYPTTTIGSFPQTSEVRSWRSKWKKGEMSAVEYENLLRGEIAASIRWQEEIGIDVLVHGEFERNDMAEYFGEQLSGFAFSQNGWVQSYGSRCVKPPIIYGDVERPGPMTVEWSAYAQSLTDKPVKGMLTGPVTILQWSFVRNDQSRSETCKQIALAIRDEVKDLEIAGIQIIQIDEPAIREGLPLKNAKKQQYLDWAIGCFRIAAGGAEDTTQIHTHMCYSEFEDMMEEIAVMDADVITMECSRSQMELLNVFSDFHYPNEIGPGVYDIHSPRVPDEQEMIALLEKAKAFIDPNQLWVNPDCGLKTRRWSEVKPAIEKMVHAAHRMRVAEDMHVR